MPKQIKQKIIEVEGIEYILRLPGLMERINMDERTRGKNGSIEDEALYRELMEHVIFLRDGSKVDFEYFEETPGFLEVMREAMAFTFRTT